MELSEILTVIGSSGTLGAIVVVSIRYATQAVEKLYTDMKEVQSKQLELSSKREEKLVDYLESKIETDKKVASTLNNICRELTCIDDRLKNLEGDDRNGYN